MKRALVIAAAAMLSCASAQALTGNDLLGMMDRDQRGSNIVLGYIRGFLDAAAYIRYARSGKESSGVFCTPEGATVDQAKDLVRSSLLADPATRHMDAGLLVYVALAKSWPCNEQGGSGG